MGSEWISVFVSCFFKNLDDWLKKYGIQMQILGVKALEQNPVSGLLAAGNCSKPLIRGVLEDMATSKSEAKRELGTGKIR